MDCPSQIPSLHGSRFCFQEQFRYYYAYGNTPAQDFLEYASSDLESREPSVLVLGCGDIRSCFHTIWKNFDPGFKHRFKGVHFVLNDRSAAVLARNIIFLYLCLKTPKSKLKKEKWLLAVWSIWFCHELLPDHKSVLQSALKTLLKYSASNRQWSSPDNPLHSLVHFFLPATFKEIRNIWSMWYNREVKVGSVEIMKAARQNEMTKLFSGTETEAAQRLIGSIGSLGMDLCKDIFTLMLSEYQSYLESGTVHGENLVGDVSTRTKETSVNLTLYERRDGKYTLHYGSCPFRCFQHTYICSIEELMDAGMHTSESVRDSMIIDTEAFKRFPLLANSFQQFSSWMSSAATFLQSQHANISFTFNSMDVFKFCQAWEIERSEKHFDIILASNVIDSVAPPAFILAVTRLLKDNSYFLSATMLYKSVSSTCEEYIEATFGFHPKLLPVICGIRCVNHEGSAYASEISPNHIPIDSTNFSMYLSNACEKILIWKKVNMYPLYVESFSPFSEISLALCKCFCSLCTPLHTCTASAGSAVLNFLCTDTATEILKTFASRLNADCAQSHTLWAQLCSDLKHQEELKPFLVSIQTQALTKGLHLHLVVDEFTCPTCANLPLSKYLGLFCVQVYTSVIFQATPMFTICLQNKPFFGLDIPWASQAVQTGSSQCIDCVIGVAHGSMLKLNFLAPLSYAKDGYRLALFQHIRTTNVKIPSFILQGELSNYQVDIPSFPPPHQPQPLLEHSSSIGTLIKHCGNGDAFESTLSFAEDGLPTLLTADLQVERISHTEVKIQCLDRFIQIVYPYPVVYGDMIVQRSRKTRTLTVKAFREAHQYVDEGQVFHVNPEDYFSLPLIKVSTDKLVELVNNQYTLKESKILVADPNASTSPLLKVKRIIRLLLTLRDDLFFHLVLPGGVIVGLVEVVNRVVDVNRKVPALDLCFCFLDTLGDDVSSFITDQLCLVKYAVVDLFLYEEAYELLKKIFWNFSSHTLESAGKYSLSPGLSLTKRCGIETHFRRAIVYPLYQDPDVNASERKCSYCKEVKPQDLKECTGCKSVFYCSKQCQRNHWSEHKLQCKSKEKGDKSPGSIEGSSSPNSEPPVVVAGQQEQPPLSTGIIEEDSRSKSPASGKQRHKELPITHKQAKLSETSEQLSEHHYQMNSGERCSYCQKPTSSSSLKSCSRCHKTSYCGKECQRAHWKEHKKECLDQKLSSCELSNTARCSYCNLHVQPHYLKKCMGCRSTSYCSKQCQTNHWSEHKLQCKSTQREEMSSLDTQGSPSPNTQPSLTAQRKQSPLLTGAVEEDSNLKPSSSEKQVTLQNHKELPVDHEEAKQSPTTEQAKQSESITHCDETCSYCQKQTASLKSCSRCHKASYCGKECQREHWKEHKKDCK